MAEISRNKYPKKWQMPSHQFPNNSKYQTFNFQTPINRKNTTSSKLFRSPIGDLWYINKLILSRNKPHIHFAFPCYFPFSSFLKLTIQFVFSIAVCFLADIDSSGCSATFHPDGSIHRITTEIILKVLHSNNSNLDWPNKSFWVKPNLKREVARTTVLTTSF